MHVEVGGQLSFFLLPCGFQGPNSGHRVWLQATSFTLFETEIDTIGYCHCSLLFSRIRIRVYYWRKWSHRTWRNEAVTVLEDSSPLFRSHSAARFSILPGEKSHQESNPVVNPLSYSNSWHQRYTPSMLVPWVLVEAATNSLVESNAHSTRQTHSWGC